MALYFDRVGYRVHVTEFGVENAKILELDFGLNPLAQRSMDEGMYLDTSWELNIENGPVGSIVLVSDSEFLRWFHAESCGIYLSKDVFHVAVLTQNDWIEVLCDQLPSLRWI